MSDDDDLADAAADASSDDDADGPRANDARAADDDAGARSADTAAATPGSRADGGFVRDAYSGPTHGASTSTAASPDALDADPEPGDPMAPPGEPCECWCMHCRRTFSSAGIWFQRVLNDPGGFKGFWKCPTPNCDGAGFTFDIFPTDPDHPANDGWSYTDADDEDALADHDDAYVEDVDPETGEPIVATGGGEDDAADWDPDETKWKRLDEQFGGDGSDESFADVEVDDDLEGEEWKLGLQPGERPPEPQWIQDARREREEEEREYDEPDRRPREVDWSDRADRKSQDGRPASGDWREDDIPF